MPRLRLLLSPCLLLGLLAAPLLWADQQPKLQLFPETIAGDWNSFHSWGMNVTPDEDILEARFTGRMPAHGHGFAVEPRLIRLGPGTFRAEGVRFHMPGDWELTFAVRTSAGWQEKLLHHHVGPRPSPKPSLNQNTPAWSPAELETLRNLSLNALPPAPPDPGNRFSTSQAAADLGKRLFFDPRLSANGKVSCATCHRPELHFTDGKVRGQGLGTTARHTPTLLGVVWGSWFFWDGRKDSLWSQALGPLEAPEEMGMLRQAIANFVRNDAVYRKDYEALFASNLDTASAEQIFVNTGKALAAYQATLRPAPARFDRFVQALLNAEKLTAAATLTSQEQAGLKLFLKPETRCLQCHNGPLFTNHQFHNIGSGAPTQPDALPDFGRLVGLQAMTFDAFRCGSQHSDTQQCEAADFAGRDNHNDLLEGAFKVPTLRAVAATAPYFHDGRHPSLRHVLQHYRKPPAQTRHELLPLPWLTDDNLEELAAFLATLTPLTAPTSDTTSNKPPHPSH